jgi:hypothetical protein
MGEPIPCGFAGHFVAAASCRFHLTHYLDSGYMVSTVGAYVRDGKAEYHEVGVRRLYETMVFRTRPATANDGLEGCDHGVVDDWQGVAMYPANTPGEATRMHLLAIEEYA